MMPKRLLPAIGTCACLLTAPAVASAPAPPSITSVKPLKLAVGQKLTIRGHGFVPGKRADSVVFLRPRARAVFVVADSATSTKIVLTLPSALVPFLKTEAGQPKPTRFQLRVLARRLGAQFTPRSLSPVVSPGVAPPPVTPIELSGPN